MHDGAVYGLTRLIHITSAGFVGSGPEDYSYGG